MKKITILTIVLVLLAVSVVPVMAKDHPNGHGNGANAGHGNSSGVNPGDREQLRQQDQDRDTNHGASGNHGQMRMRTPFYLQGTIKAITAKTITVTLIHGNARVKRYIGKELTLQINDSTLIFQITQGDENGSETEGTETPTLSSDETQSNRIPITFDKLVAGQKVAIHGNLVDNVYTARLITVYLQASVGESTGEQP